MTDLADSSRAVTTFCERSRRQSRLVHGFSGQYGNTSEYIRELIRRDQRDQDALRLRAMLEDGLASGPAIADEQEDWDELEAIARGRLD